MNLLHAVLHLLCSVVVLPYVALALFYIFIGQLASSKGMLDLIENLWDKLWFYFTKGMFIAPVLWIVLVTMGFLPSFQRTGSICLLVLAVASLIVMFAISPDLEFGHILFLLPCVAVAGTSAWQAFRASVAA